MKIGDKAPEILGRDEQGNQVRMSDFRVGNWCCISILKMQRQVVRHRRATCVTIMKNCSSRAMPLWG